MRRENIKTCPVTGKLRFPRRKLAVTAMNHANAEYGYQRIKGYYRCRFCKDWHMTKEEQDESLCHANKASR